jgi:hypothetical protein
MVHHCAMPKLVPLVLAGLLGLAAPALAEDPAPERTGRPAQAALYMISPADGATVTSPVTVRFGLAGMGVAPAGVRSPDTGHHHLLIDVDLPPAGLPVPADDNHRHFGKGQTETVLELAPGTHTLQLILGDHDHVPHEPPLTSPQITINVAAD